ncbi:hypothetical protein Tco_0206079 [Tanacetum coccineum]
MKYLGVPLITKKITANDCEPLVEKVKSRILDWRNKALSYLGRLQLIASVLSAMQIYWASVFLLPKNVIYEINKMLKGARRIGIMVLQVWNMTVLDSYGEITAKTNSSAGWKEMLKLRDKIRNHVLWKIGNGMSINAWYDNWSPSGISMKKWLEIMDCEYPILNQFVMPIIHKEIEDEVIWSSYMGI